MPVAGNFVKAYFWDVSLFLSMAGFTTGGQRLEMGIMAGCTISALELFIEVITKGFQWVVGGAIM